MELIEGKADNAFSTENFKINYRILQIQNGYTGSLYDVKKICRYSPK